MAVADAVGVVGEEDSSHPPPSVRAARVRASGAERGMTGDASTIRQHEKLAFVLGDRPIRR